MITINHDGIIITIENDTISTTRGISRTISTTVPMSKLINIFDQLLLVDNEIIRLDKMFDNLSAIVPVIHKKTSYRKYLSSFTNVSTNFFSFIAQTRKSLDREPNIISSRV